MPIYALFGLLFFSFVAAAPAPSSKEVLLSAGVPSHKIALLDQGEIISHGIDEGTDKELAMSVAIYLPAHPDKVIDYIKSVELFAIDADVTAYGAIPKNANVYDFKGFGFSLKQLDEALDLLDTEESDRFNLSIQEISVLQNTPADTDKAILVKKVSQKYREILQQRWQAYRNNGLKGIADYSRVDGVASPAAELYISAENCKMLTHYFPELSHGWNNYPASLPSGVEEYFYWINRLVENRPTAILAHSVLQVTNTGSLILGRQFYVGHSYNSSQMCVGVLPYHDGSLVFYIESTSTDQVAGIATGLRHIIGREQLKNQMIKHLEKLGKTFKIASKDD